MMKREHIIAFGGTWYHFFIKPAQGLCVSKKADARFTFSECILPGAYDDFYAAATEKHIHVVCQDATGAIVYLTFDGETWTTRRLLENRDKTPAFKNLTLTLIGNFVNLFYVIHSKDDDILVHQLLGDAAGQPKVVDYIQGTDFSVCSHQTSDLTLLYRNGEEVYGTKKFRWSRKDFDGFQPLDCGCNLEHAAITADEDDNLQIAAYAAFDKFVNILFLTKNTNTDDCAISAVHLVSGQSEGLAMSDVGGRLSISWGENGLVMTTALSENNKWNAPKKYIRGTTQENVLYHIQSDSESFFTYGYRQDGKIMLYLTRDILEHPPKEKPRRQAHQGETPNGGTESHRRQNTPAGTEHAQQLEFNSRHGTPGTDYVRRSVYTADMAAVRKLLKSQNDIIVEVLKKITALERAAMGKTDLAEDMGQIDRLAAENAAREDGHK